MRRSRYQQIFNEKETTVMNKQDKQEPDNQQSVIEDLTVNEDQTAELKGGAGPVYSIVIDRRPGL